MATTFKVTRKTVKDVTEVAVIYAETKEEAEKAMKDNPQEVLWGVTGESNSVKVNVKRVKSKEE